MDKLTFSYTVELNQIYIDRFGRFQKVVGFLKPHTVLTKLCNKQGVLEPSSIGNGSLATTITDMIATWSYYDPSLYKSK